MKKPTNLRRILDEKIFDEVRGGMYEATVNNLDWILFRQIDKRFREMHLSSFYRSIYISLKTKFKWT